MLLLVASAASAQSLCGNGVLDVDEQCDFAVTASGADECDGCALDCTVTEECGLAACDDGIDNDGNGRVDATDASCALLADLQSVAILATGKDGPSIQMRRGAQVTRVNGRSAGSQAPYPLGASRSDVCGRGVRVGALAKLDGSLTATGEARFQQRDAAGIGGELIVTAPQQLQIHGSAPWVGQPIGRCSGSGAACLSRLDCRPRETCDGRREAGAGNPAVDLTGSGIGADDLARCAAAGARLDDFADGIIEMDSEATTMDVSGDHRRVRVQVGPGLNLLHYSSLWIGSDGELTIDGPTDAIVVVQVDGAMRLLSNAVVRVDGGLQVQNVLWSVIHGRPNPVSIGVNAVLDGSLMALQRKVVIKRGTVLHGAVYAERVLLQPYARVEHVPFAAQLPAATDSR